MADELSKGFTGLEINGVRFSNLGEMLRYMDKQRDCILKLEKENAELKRDKEDLIFIRNQNAKCMCEDKENLIKAKELLKRWVELYKPKLEGYPITPIQEQTEQFISEV